MRPQLQFCKAPSNEFETSGKGIRIWMPSLPPYSRYHHTARTRIHGPRLIDEYYPQKDGCEEESQTLGNHSSPCHALELNRSIPLCRCLDIDGLRNCFGLRHPNGNRRGHCTLLNLKIPQLEVHVSGASRSLFATWWINYGYSVNSSP